MSSIAISSIVFGCVFIGSLFGMFLRPLLPETHLSGESKDIVKLTMGLVATMSALVLGLLVSSAKTFNDSQSAEVTEMSAKVLLLDRILAHYGPESQDARDQLRVTVIDNINRVWPRERSQTSELAPRAGADILIDKVQALSPRDDRQRSLQAQALNLVISLAQTRLLLYEQKAASVSMPMLVILVFWLTMIFFSFGLLAPGNATVVASLFVSGLSVSGAILLILEMYTPFGGLVAISSAPLRFAVAHLGQ